MAKNKTAIIFIGLAVAILIDCFFILPSQISNSRNIRVQLKEIREKLGALDKDIQNKGNYEAEKQAVEAKLADLQGRFLSKDDSTLIMSEINRLAKQANLEVIRFRPGKLEEISRRGHINFYYLPVDLRLKTSYHRMGAFLNKLEKLDFSLELKQLRIEGDFPDLQVSLQICGVVREQE
ncbi:type 4a pilus biogenesis protein PilO [Candidatus Omnitrophota bacterium]